jgi:hypothetical protein
MSEIFTSALSWADNADPQEIYEDRAFVLRMLEWGATQERWDDVLRLGKASEAPMALGGRHGAWKQVLEYSWNAARLMEPRDKAAEAWALHQLGSRSLLRDQLGAARVLLHESLRRQPDRDCETAALTRNNLGLIPAAIVVGGVLLLWLVFLVPAAIALIGGTEPFDPNLDVKFEEKVSAPASELEVQATKPLRAESAATATVDECRAAPGRCVVVTVVIDDQTRDGEPIAAGDGGFCIAEHGECISLDSVPGEEAPGAFGSSEFGAAVVPGQPLAMVAAAENTCPIEVLDDDTVTALVPRDEACVLEVGFQPQVAGLHRATLSLRTVGDGSVDTGELEGTAIAAPNAIADIHPDKVEFSKEETTATISIANVGTDAFRVAIEPLEGFHISRDECSTEPLAAHVACEFTIERRDGEVPNVLRIVLTPESEAVDEVAGDDAILLVGG